jgi:hypothetical protein
LRPSIEHSCAQCRAISVLYGAQVFVPHPCAKCGAINRARSEIGGYLLGPMAARSGLSVVFHATDPTGTPVAVKLVQPPFTAGPRDVEYFVSEVWALARLNHPNSLRIFAAGVERGMAWIAMEWLTEGSLARRIATRGALREAEVLVFGAQAAAALGAAFAAGHTHRNLTPDNLVFADARTVKVTDFTQAALYQLTAYDMGTMWGRAWYVSPERLRNESEEAPSDIYALGTVLYHALAGTPLHGGEPYGLTTLEMIETEKMQVEVDLPNLHERTARTLNRMLAAETSDRFQHWNEVVTELIQATALVARRDALARSAKPEPPKPVMPLTPASKPQATSRSWVWIAAAVFAVALIGAIGATRYRRPVALKTATPGPVVAITSTPTPQPTPAPPPAFDWKGWQSVALGRGGARPNSEVLPQGGALRLSSAGMGISGDKEDAGFHHSLQEGDWTLTARIGVHDGAAGLSVRDRPAGDRPALTLWLTRENSVAAAVRRKAGPKSEIIVPVPSPKVSWLRLVRQGPNFTAESSTDGAQWKQVARLQGAGIPAQSAVGFVVWSGTNGRTATAVFDEVSLTRGK